MKLKLKCVKTMCTWMFFSLVLIEINPLCAAKCQRQINRAQTLATKNINYNTTLDGFFINLALNSIQISQTFSPGLDLSLLPGTNPYINALNGNNGYNIVNINELLGDTNKDFIESFFTFLALMNIYSSNPLSENQSNLNNYTLTISEAFANLLFPSTIGQTNWSNAVSDYQKVFNKIASMFVQMNLTLEAMKIAADSATLQALTSTFIDQSQAYIALWRSVSDLSAKIKHNLA